MRLPRRSAAPRPAAARRAVGGRPDVHRRWLAGRAPLPEPAPAPVQRRATLTGRAAVLAVVACAVVLSLAYPARTFFAQRAQIAEVRARNAVAAQRVAELQAQQQRWRDPAYIRTQARERLHLVLPGETAYIVLRPKPAGPAGPAAAGQSAAARQGAWYLKVWDSVRLPSPAPRR